MRRAVTVAGLIQVAAFLLVTCSIIASLRIPHWAFELPSHFRFQYFWAGIVLFMVCFASRDWWSTGAVALITVLNGWYVLSWFEHMEQSVEADVPLKLLHANVLARNDQYERFLELVRNEDPDIVFVQEFTSRWETGLDALRQQWPHVYLQPRDSNFGIAVYSKHPFDQVRHIDSPPLGYPTIVATLSIGQKTVNLVSTHPTIPLGGQLFKARNEHIRHIADLVNSLSGPTIVSGDFNATVWDRRLLEFESDTALLNARRGFGIIATWPTAGVSLFSIPIDHLFVSGQIVVRKIGTGPDIGSDHLPLIATLSL